MKKIDLMKIVEEFETISYEHQPFYNIETGEFDFYIDPMLSGIEDDYERFNDDCWIALPSQRELGEYDIMADFTDTVADPRANELLSIALEGKGAFRRFKDTLHRVGLADEWYAFKRKVYTEIARDWCEANDIPYIDNEKNPETKTATKTELAHPENVIVIPFHPNIAEDATEVLCDALDYSKHNAASEVKRMLSSKRIALAAITKDMRVAGIIGAIPRYGVTGWEMHPLAVLKEYQGRGFGRLLIETLEREVAARGGVMIYLGSDDDTGTTSLYGADLYDDTFGKLANIQNIGGHPFPFYEKMGYKIVGVFPDANGIGKPDIWLAKRITRKRGQNK